MAVPMRPCQPETGSCLIMSQSRPGPVRASSAQLETMRAGGDTNLIRTLYIRLSLLESEAGPGADAKTRAIFKMTAIGYFDALRKLGGARRIVEGEIGPRLQRYDRRFRVNKTFHFERRHTKYDIVEIIGRADRQSRPGEASLGAAMAELTQDSRKHDECQQQRPGQEQADIEREPRSGAPLDRPGRVGDQRDTPIGAKRTIQPQMMTLATWR
jgi:hypothetical protein